MVLYHAVSSYQLLEVILHKMTYHKRECAVLILPDFIVEKYPQYEELVKMKIFSNVYLFPYLYIPHNQEETIIDNVKQYYQQMIPHKVEAFSKIYIAGSHFYFSLYLIHSKVSFDIFEDAAGMLSRVDEMYNNLSQKFPLHAEIARKYGLFNGDNQYIQHIFCLKKAQTIDVTASRYINFDVEKQLKASYLVRKKIIKFFNIRFIKSKKKDAILLTQNFSEQGIMSVEEQEALYRGINSEYYKSGRLYIKVHPDDGVDYKKIFPEAIIIEDIFPSELLPFIFILRPETIITINSTGIESLKKSFKNVINVNLED